MARIFRTRVPLSILTALLAGTALAVGVPDGTMVFNVGGDGGGVSTGDGGPVSKAQFNMPSDVFVASDGKVYIADRQGEKVRRIDPATGIITIFAGDGTTGSGGDGFPATIPGAQFWFVEGMCFAASGNCYVADYNNNAVRKITSGTYVLTTFTKTGTQNPSAVAVDASENIYVSSFANNSVMKFTADGTIVGTTLAGTGVSGFSGDDGQANSAQLSDPNCIVFDQTGHVYIADRGNGRIRKVNQSTGIITTYAGGGTDAGEGGPALGALIAPHGLAFDPQGNLYFSDADCRIRKVTEDGKVYTVAGTAASKTYYGDGVRAIDASFWIPEGIAFDADKKLYIADGFNNHIRVLTIPMPVITKEMSLPGRAERGTVITYTLGWKNIGSGTVFNLTLTDPVPAHMEFVDMDTPFVQNDSLLITPAITPAPTATAGAVAPVLKWVVNRVEPGKSGMIRFRVRVRDTVTDGLLISNQASATCGVDGQVYRTAVLTATAYVAPATTPSATVLNQTQLLDKIRAGAKVIIAPNKLSLANPTSAIAIAIKGDAGKDAEVVVYGEDGGILRTLQVPVAADGTGSVSYDGRDDKGKRLGPGFYWAMVKGTKDKKRFVVTGK